MAKCYRPVSIKELKAAAEKLVKAAATLSDVAVRMTKNHVEEVWIDWTAVSDRAIIQIESLSGESVTELERTLSEKAAGLPDSRAKQHEKSRRDVEGRKKRERAAARKRAAK